MEKILVNGAPVDYSGLPEQARGSMERYIEHGIPAGGFLTAVLENDLMGAVSRADSVNKHLLAQYCQWLYTCAPRRSFGSVEQVDAWIKERAEAREAQS